MHDAKYQQSAEQVCAGHGKTDTYIAFPLSLIHASYTKNPSKLTN
jgi:hypothetical protein